MLLYAEPNNWTEALSANMLPPIQLIHALLAQMISTQFSRIVNITSTMTTTLRQYQANRVGHHHAFEHQNGDV